MVPKRALITGISGQDGSYLAEFLLSRGYEVFGTVRRHSAGRPHSTAAIRERVVLIPADLTDSASLVRALREASPDEVYNLAAQSFVGSSWSLNETTADVTALGANRLLLAVLQECPGCRFYQASSSEMFGFTTDERQHEQTPFRPRSPYANSKLFAHYATINSRESYGLFACCGILFNHESPRRGLEFVTRKITNGVARICLGMDDQLHLGNLQAVRDWGFAGDYVSAMWRMLQQDEPQEYVIGTGTVHSVAQFAEISFGVVGLDWRDYVVCDERLLRPADVEFLCADASKARSELGWEPRVSFEQLVECMVESDLKRLDHQRRRPAHSDVDYFSRKNSN